MALGEFEIIQDIFSAGVRSISPHVECGIGDDAAVLTIPPGMQQVVSIDTLSPGVHFPKETCPFNIGYKSLAVSLSDIASMGASPFAVLLSVTLPESDGAWVQEFARGFFSLADQHGVMLVGGDTVRGSLGVSTVVHGLVESGKSLYRHGAQVGDLIYVTGTFGDAGYALRQYLGQGKVGQDFFWQRLNRPSPRVVVGLSINKLAHAAIDISDGLLADLERMLTLSGVGADVFLETVPLSTQLAAQCDQRDSWELALTSGDDYELCFTIPVDNQVELEKTAQAWDCPIHCIGKIVDTKELVLYDAEGCKTTFAKKGYEHFNEKDNSK